MSKYTLSSHCDVFKTSITYRVLMLCCCAMQTKFTDYVSFLLHLLCFSSLCLICIFVSLSQRRQRTKNIICLHTETTVAKTQNFVLRFCELFILQRYLSKCRLFKSHIGWQKLLFGFGTNLVNQIQNFGQDMRTFPGIDRSLIECTSLLQNWCLVDVLKWIATA